MLHNANLTALHVSAKFFQAVLHVSAKFILLLLFISAKFFRAVLLISAKFKNMEAKTYDGVLTPEHIAQLKENYRKVVSVDIGDGDETYIGYRSAWSSCMA